MPEKNCLGLKNERKQIPLPCDKKGCLICNDKKKSFGNYSFLWNLGRIIDWAYLNIWLATFH